MREKELSIQMDMALEKVKRLKAFRYKGGQV